jgi:hypothetical protein
MISSSGDVTLPINKFEAPSATTLNTLQALQTNVFSNNFKRKENKFFANLINNSSPTNGEVLWGASSSGIKGFYSTVIMEVTATTQTFSGKIELFAVSSDTVESSY